MKSKKIEQKKMTNMEEENNLSNQEYDPFSGEGTSFKEFSSNLELSNFNPKSI